MKIGVVLLGDYWHLQSGDEVRAPWSRGKDVPVGERVNRQRIIKSHGVVPLGRQGQALVASGALAGRASPRPPFWTVPLPSATPANRYQGC